MNYLNNIISKHVIKSSLYKKEKYKFLYINFSALLISSLGIISWFDQLSIELLNKKIQYIILAIACIIDVVFVVISVNAETNDIDCTFLRKYNQRLSSLESLTQLKGNCEQRSVKHIFDFLLSLFVTLIVSPFFSNILAGQELSQIFFFMLLALIYVVCITGVNMILLIFNLSALKYDCLLEMIYLYEIESNVRRNSFSKKVRQVLNFFGINNQD